MDKHLELVNKLFDVLVGSITIIECWGVYLFDSEFDQEIELRNKVGTIWLCALLDTIRAEQRYIPEIIREAESLGFSILVENAKEIINLCQLTKELVSQFSMEEQVFLTSIRNQWVHGYLAGRHKERVTYNYLDDAGKVIKQEFTQKELEDINRKVFNPEGLDSTLYSIVSKGLNRKHRYWMGVKFVMKYKYEIYSALKSDKKITIIV
ncbi:hypothetical protein AKN93_02400 [Thiopseudomonas alkaliphila]|uniref:hypothetical protein n=1 Tax=Thiopseudomonas alkaliphila TaxID=1697053 RepID=UPI00069D6943|nr:hypothetical protein [Thiopseudomonas alkaliphila]AKX47405.1 hypothetical protein AKN94_08600 [Thiopseudomonas alkaliphila]AKX48386.1 hypothetical protein AKN93_02400 [Thiopseudomonas alkaliphila]